MRILITTDLHLTAAPSDAYRWELFDWLHEVIADEKIDALFILGDLADAKDRHPAKLVNKLFTSILKLAVELDGGGVHVLKGNHDYLDPKESFWKFLGVTPRCWFYTNPHSFIWEGRTFTFLPHCSYPEQEWKSMGRLFEQSDYIFMHATAKGAEVSNGSRMDDGLDPGYFNGYRCIVFSGDVHVPQGPQYSREQGARTTGGNKQGILYVGSPYRIRFGDDYDPRICILDTNDSSVAFIRSEITMWKGEIYINEAAELYEQNLEKGDRVKVVLNSRWMQYGGLEEEKHAIRKACEDIGVELCSLNLGDLERKEPMPSPKDRKGEGEILFEYAEHADLTLEVAEAGLELLP